MSATLSWTEMRAVISPWPPFGVNQIRVSLEQVMNRSHTTYHRVHSAYHLISVNCCSPLHPQKVHIVIILTLEIR